MALWEYKVITSGKGGFASPALLEKFLNDLGKDEWEIIDFRTQPDNALAFSGLARRTTQRDWTLEDAAAAAARTEADKLRAEFEAKFRSATTTAPGDSPDAPEGAATEKPGTDDGLRRLRDTDRDLDPDAPDEEPKDEWDMLKGEDELPSFFEALRPHLRRNQRGPGMSVGVDFLAKKWDLSEDDIKTALGECGFVMPADENAKSEYLEYEGDLYWLNINRRGELWINTKEKPRPVFRVVQGQRVASESVEETRTDDRGQRTEDGSPGTEGKSAADEPGAGSAQREEGGRQNQERQGGKNKGSRDQGGSRDRSARSSEQEISSEPLPAGPELLERIRPHMRRNRRGPGGSGSTSFLARALKCREADLVSAFNSLGLVEPAPGAEDPAPIEIGDGLWFLNRDQRGGLWINGRLKSEDGGQRTDDGGQRTEDGGQRTEDGGQRTEDGGQRTEDGGQRTEDGGQRTEDGGQRTEDGGQRTEDGGQRTDDGGQRSDGGAPVVAAPVGTPATASGDLLAAVRPRLAATKTGSFAAEISNLAHSLGRDEADLVAALTEAGLKVPEKAREKPVFVERAGEIFWFNRNAKDEIWVNAKASKYPSDDDGDEKPAKRPRPKKQED